MLSCHLVLLRRDIVASSAAIISLDVYRIACMSLSATSDMHYSLQALAAERPVHAWQATSQESLEASSAADSSGTDAAAEGAADQNGGHEQPCCSSGAYRVQLAADESAGTVHLMLHCGPMDTAASGQHDGSRAEGTQRRHLEQEEAVLKSGGPDRPSSGLLLQSATSGSVPEQQQQQEGGGQQRLAWLRGVRNEVRAGVVALTERAACCEGAPDNEPEVRRVRAYQSTR